MQMESFCMQVQDLQSRLSLAEWQLHEKRSEIAEVTIETLSWVSNLWEFSDAAEISD